MSDLHERIEFSGRRLASDPVKLVRSEGETLQSGMITPYQLYFCKTHPPLTSKISSPSPSPLRATKKRPGILCSPGL